MSEKLYNDEFNEITTHDVYFCNFAAANSSFSRIVVMAPISDGDKNDLNYGPNWNQGLLNAYVDLIKQGASDVYLLPNPGKLDFVSEFLTKNLGPALSRHISLADPQGTVFARAQQFGQQVHDIIPHIDWIGWEPADTRDFIGVFYTILAGLHCRAEVPTYFSWFFNRLHQMICDMESKRLTNLPLYDELVLLQSAMSLYSPVEVGSLRIKIRGSQTPFRIRIDEILSEAERTGLSESRRCFGLLSKSRVALRDFQRLCATFLRRHSHLMPVAEHVKIAKVAKSVASTVFFDEFAPPLIDLGGLQHTWPGLPSQIAKVGIDPEYFFGDGKEFRKWTLWPH